MFVHIGNNIILKQEDIIGIYNIKAIKNTNEYIKIINNLKDNNAKVVKYEKGDDFKNIENIVKNEPAFIVTNSMGDYINSIEDVIY